MRRIVDSILKIQEERRSFINWVQFFLGGILGFFFSILANVVHKAIQKKKRIREEEQEEMVQEKETVEVDHDEEK